MGASETPQIHLKQAQSSSFFLIKGRENKCVCLFFKLKFQADVLACLNQEFRHANTSERPSIPLCYKIAYMKPKLDFCWSLNSKNRNKNPAEQCLPHAERKQQPCKNWDELNTLSD